MSAPAVTPAAIQAVLGTGAANAQILQAQQTDTATAASYYVRGNVDAAGRERWVATTNSDSAAVQAAAILVGLRA